MIRFTIRIDLNLIKDASHRYDAEPLLTAVVGGRTYRSSCYRWASIPAGRVVSPLCLFFFLTMLVLLLYPETAGLWVGFTPRGSAGGSPGL